jgi:hypothetical protein
MCLLRLIKNFFVLVLTYTKYIIDPLYLQVTQQLQDEQHQ